MFSGAACQLLALSAAYGGTSPARGRGSPLSLAALAGVSPALPEGEPSARASVTARLMVRQTKNGPFCWILSVEGASFSLFPPKGGCRAATGGTHEKGGGWDSIKTMRGQPFGRPRRGTLSFVTQKFFCFGAINNRRNYWLGISFLLSHWMGVYPDKQAVSEPGCPLYQPRLWCSGSVIS